MSAGLSAHVTDPASCSQTPEILDFAYRETFAKIEKADCQNGSKFKTQMSLI